MLLLPLRICMFVFILVGVMLPDSAQADLKAPSTEPPLRVNVIRDNYSDEIVLADLVGAGLTIRFLTDDKGAGSILRFSYPIASPVVHLSHGNFGRALASLGLHLFLPYAGAYLGYSLEKASCEEGEFLCGLAGAFLGGLFGLVAATTIDAGYLARPGDQDRRDAIRRSSGILPSVTVTPNGTFAFGLSGTI
jgi:hypothetical protein